MNLSELLAIFVLVQEAISERIVLRENNGLVPLAVRKKRDSPTLELAIPQKSDEIGEYAYYSYDDSEDVNGSAEKLMGACIERRNSYQYVLNNYVMHGTQCDWRGVPSINEQKEDENGDVEYCGESNAKIYQIGFPVESSDRKDSQFMYIYKICHSSVSNRGTLYSIHRIESPSLLLQEAWEYYKPNAEEIIESFLDRRAMKEQFSSEVQYPYQFVGKEDMPTKLWEETTKFYFNHTPITLNKYLIKGMITVDNYIRVYSKETNKPLTLYSGVYQTTVNKAPRSIPCLPILCGEPKPVTVQAFWRIIKDDQGLATIIVTQHTEIECFDESYICSDRMFENTYRKGGCTYICRVTRDIIQQLGLPLDMGRLDLPPLDITGHLALTFPRKSGKEPKEVSISDFFKKRTLKSALKYVDPSLASAVNIHAS